MNKTIWMYWGQGWDKSPYLSKKCLLSWKHYNPNWDLKCLDDNTVENYLPGIITKYSNKRMERCHLADIIRVSLLQKYGGVWSDATLFCNKPLDEWLPEGAFFFSNPTPQYLISNWFIKGSPNDYIINKLLSTILNYWNVHDEAHDYFWFHESFRNLYNTDVEFKSSWDKQVKISSNSFGGYDRGPHLFIPYQQSFVTEPNDQYINRITSKMDPVYKLTWKVPLQKGSVVDYLLNTIDD